MIEKKNFRSGFVGVLGLPNAGKSTLVNSLVGEKVSIVTHKRQTTRQKVLGIYSDDFMQVVFMDAPGVIKSDTGLNSFLEQEWKNTIKESQFLIVTLNIDERDPQKLFKMIDLAIESKKPWMAVITKTDLKHRQRVDTLKFKLKDHSVPVIETTLKNTPETIQKIFDTIYFYLEDSPAFYENDIYTTQNLKEMLAENIREKCFFFLHQEIPYGLAVKVNEFKEEENLISAQADIILNKRSHQSMVIGKGGQILKKVGTLSRVDFEKLMNKKVFLELYVKTKANWVKDPRLLRELGYAKEKR